MFALTKLITAPEGCDFYMLGGFATLKEAANAATEEYKEYNKKASFVNLEMVNEWLATRGEYSFRQDRQNRIQLDISDIQEGKVIPAEHQRIYHHENDESAAMNLSESICPDGVTVAEK